MRKDLRSITIKRVTVAESLGSEAKVSVSPDSSPFPTQKSRVIYFEIGNLSIVPRGNKIKINVNVALPLCLVTHNTLKLFGGRYAVLVLTPEGGKWSA
jgi:hypothetical protein